MPANTSDTTVDTSDLSVGSKKGSRRRLTKDQVEEFTQLQEGQAAAVAAERAGLQAPIDATREAAVQAAAASTIELAVQEAALQQAQAAAERAASTSAEELATQEAALQAAREEAQQAGTTSEAALAARGEALQGARDAAEAESLAATGALDARGEALQADREEAERTGAESEEGLDARAAEIADARDAAETERLAATGALDARGEALQADREEAERTGAESEEGLDARTAEIAAAREVAETERLAATGALDARDEALQADREEAERTGAESEEGLDARTAEIAAAREVAEAERLAATGALDARGEALQADREEADSTRAESEEGLDARAAEIADARAAAALSSNISEAAVTDQEAALQAARAAAALSSTESAAELDHLNAALAAFNAALATPRASLKVDSLPYLDPAAPEDVLTADARQFMMHTLSTLYAENAAADSPIPFITWLQGIEASTLVARLQTYYDLDNIAVLDATGRVITDATQRIDTIVDILIRHKDYLSNELIGQDSICNQSFGSDESDTAQTFNQRKGLGEDALQLAPTERSATGTTTIKSAAGSIDPASLPDLYEKMIIEYYRSESLDDPIEVNFGQNIDPKDHPEVLKRVYDTCIRLGAPAPDMVSKGVTLTQDDLVALPPEAGIVPRQKVIESIREAKKILLFERYANRQGTQTNTDFHQEILNKAYAKLADTPKHQSVMKAALGDSLIRPNALPAPTVVAASDLVDDDTPDWLVTAEEMTANSGPYQILTQALLDSPNDYDTIMGHYNALLAALTEDLSSLEAPEDQVVTRSEPLNILIPPPDPSIKDKVAELQAYKDETVIRVVQRISEGTTALYASAEQWQATMDADNSEVQDAPRGTDDDAFSEADDDAFSEADDDPRSVPEDQSQPPVRLDQALEEASELATQREKIDSERADSGIGHTSPPAFQASSSQDGFAKATFSDLASTASPESSEDSAAGSSDDAEVTPPSTLAEWTADAAADLLSEAPVMSQPAVPADSSSDIKVVLPRLEAMLTACADEPWQKAVMNYRAAVIGYNTALKEGVPQGNKQPPKSLTWPQAFLTVTEHWETKHKSAVKQSVLIQDITHLTANIMENTQKPRPRRTIGFGSLWNKSSQIAAPSSFGATTSTPGASSRDDSPKGPVRGGQ